MQALAKPRRRSPSATRGLGMRKRSRRYARASARGREALPCSSASPAAASPGVPETNSASPGAAPERVSAAARRHEPQQLHRHAQRAVRGVTADQCDAVLARQRAQTCGKFLQPALLGLRQRQREQRPGRTRAHGGKVTEVHGQRAVADGGGG